TRVGEVPGGALARAPVGVAPDATVDDHSDAGPGRASRRVGGSGDPDDAGDGPEQDRRQQAGGATSHFTTRKVVTPLRFAYLPRTTTLAWPSLVPTRKVRTTLPFRLALPLLTSFPRKRTCPGSPATKPRTTTRCSFLRLTFFFTFGLSFLAPSTLTALVPTLRPAASVIVTVRVAVPFGRRTAKVARPSAATSAVVVAPPETAAL